MLAEGLSDALALLPESSGGSGSSRGTGTGAAGASTIMSARDDKENDREKEKDITVGEQSGSTHPQTQSQSRAHSRTSSTAAASPRRMSSSTSMSPAGCSNSDSSACSGGGNVGSAAYSHAHANAQHHPHPPAHAHVYGLSSGAALPPAHGHAGRRAGGWRGSAVLASSSARIVQSPSQQSAVSLSLSGGSGAGSGGSGAGSGGSGAGSGGTAPAANSSAGGGDWVHPSHGRGSFDGGDNAGGSIGTGTGSGSVGFGGGGSSERSGCGAASGGGSASTDSGSVRTTGGSMIDIASSVHAWDFADHPPHATGRPASSPPGALAHLPPLIPLPASASAGTAAAEPSVPPAATAALAEGNRKPAAKGPARELVQHEARGDGDSGGVLEGSSEGECADACDESAEQSMMTDPPLYGPGDEGQYDWANFVFAYSRGRWDPLRLPRPPGRSSLYPGILTRISLNGTPVADIKVLGGRRPSLEYASSDGGGSASGAVLELAAQNAVRMAKEKDEVVAGAGRSSSSATAVTEGSIESPLLAKQRDKAAIDDDANTTAAAAAHAAALRSPSQRAVPATPELDHLIHASTESAWNVPTTNKIEACEKEKAQRLQHKQEPFGAGAIAASEAGAGTGGGISKPLHSKTPPTPVSAGQDVLDYVQGLNCPANLSHDRDECLWQSEQKYQQRRHEASSRAKRQQQQQQQGSGGDGVASKSTPSGLLLTGRRAAVHDEDEKDEEGRQAPHRPQPTPLQPMPVTFLSEPAYGWDSVPEGTSTTLEQVMARQASQGSQGDAPSLFLASDGGSALDNTTLDGLRRAARRASFERRAATLPLKNSDGKLQPHSLSFPPNLSKAKAMIRPYGILRMTEAKLGVSWTTTSAWPIAKQVAGPQQPAREEPFSSISNSASMQDVTAHDRHSHEQRQGATPMRLNPPSGSLAGREMLDRSATTDGSAPTSYDDLPPTRPSHRKRSSSSGGDARGGGSSSNSSSNAQCNSPSKGEDDAGDAGGSGTGASAGAGSTINTYVAAGRQAEAFFRENGYLPAVPPPNELDRRKALRRYGPPKLSGNANFDRIAHLVKLVFNTKLVLISLIGEREQIFRTESGGGGDLNLNTLQRLAGSRDCSFCGHAILQDGDEPIVVLDAAKDWRFAGNPLVTSVPNIRFYAGSPLRTADGYNIGSLCVIDNRPRDEFSPRQRHTLREFARIVMREMELLRDRMHFEARDRMQHSIENFTRECLEMDLEESTDGEVHVAQGARRIYGLAAETMQEALQANGAVVFDLSHFELIESFPPDSEDSSTKIFFPSPYSHPDLKPFASTDKPDELDVVDSPFWDGSHKGGALKSKLVPPMIVLGTSEDQEPPLERADPVPLSHHVQVAQFLRAHPAGRFYPYTPTPLRHLLPDGISRLLVVPIFGLNRQPFAMLCTYSLSTEEGSALEELKETGLQYLRAIGMIILSAVLRKDIMLADKAKSHFISNISHELRTPLHGILAAAELLAETKLSATQGSYLDTVEACGKSLLELVNHVLDFTKLSGSSRSKGLPSHNKTKCDLVRLVQEVCESSWIGQMAKTLGMQSNSGIGSLYAPPESKIASVAAVPQKLVNNDVETVIEISFRENGWLVNCDTGGIRRVLMNLIGNSLKFTSAGFVHVSLRELSSTDTHIIVELGVTDTGRGISRHFLEEQLFHPFTQENTLGTGTGLGLSIVNSIVQSPAMNGKIDVWSTEGQGTEIKVTCELEKATAQEMEGVVYTSSLDVAGEYSFSLLGFGEPRGQQDLKEVLLGYLCGWWKFALAEESVERVADMVIINEDVSLLEALHVSASSSLPPAIILTSSRGGQEMANACNIYHEAGGVARILFKPCGPAKLEAVVDFCLQCVERTREGKPPLEEATKADTPLPSPNAHNISVINEENQDYFTLEKHDKELGETDDTPEANPDITPRGLSHHSNASQLHPEGFYMSPPAPNPGSSNASLIRRHSAEDKWRSGRVMNDPKEVPAAKRPLLPARSITYHEPRLHKHVLLSPMSRDRLGEGENSDYFADVNGSGNASSPSTTPGSTVSLEGGEGTILKNVVHPARPPGAPAPRKRMQILSVEDNPINRNVIAAFLEKINVDYAEAVNGEEGVKIFEAHPPNHFDVILMDLSMPVLDGIGATAAIRRVEAERYTASLAASANSNTSSSSSTGASSRVRPILRHQSPRSRVKIFALTGRSSDEDKRMAFATGADGYIVKPLSFKVLSSLLKMLSQ
ncbi:hypothetical protein K437DRAFT_259454 [Tilletiaria anomala UBC 951]|uniref:histidine kinase n=1 Tax=Tilletiaria anomala (strain ATCC 24038 / CBS 436.72 / UBC 951) TaxID=1037660 RepID=A0A066VHY2_TILAU|nr:uncharacterized protein K437DRAFT_259454 [Tilletiaria anomala UBC 951]KDN38329.1 hypothetical protein K437DRAFT_259454 [Tilletiaria anomala UBC 951]